MANPFPGMNPYLEQPEFWSDCHNQLITAIARALSPQLVPKYRVVTDKWVYTLTDTVMMALGQPDVSLQRQRLPQPPRKTASIPTLEPIPVQVPMPLEMSQSYLQVKDTVTQAVVTIIEVLSPANKRGEGRAQYEAKRQQVLASQTHLVEIDLLRGGAPLMAEAVAAQWHYRLLVSRTAQRPVADLYAFNLPTPIPPLPIPLSPEDVDATLDLQPLLNQIYADLGYDYFIDYQQLPPPPWTLAEVQAVQSPACLSATNEDASMRD